MFVQAIAKLCAGTATHEKTGVGKQFIFTRQQLRCLEKSEDYLPCHHLRLDLDIV